MNRTLVLVEDDAAFARTLARSFERRGYTVFVAHDQAALERLLEEVAPAFAVVIIWQFTSMWNDFLFAVFLTGPQSWPATVLLNNIAGAQATPYSQQMAAAIISSIPTMIVYVLLGRFFMRGLMAGALKG